MKNCIKRLLPILLLSLLPALMMANPNKPRFFMTYNIKGDSLGKAKADALTTPFFGFLGDALEKEYPCIEQLSINETRSLIGYSRQQDLMGGSAGGEGIKNISGAMGADYLIVLNITCYYNSGTLLFYANCTDVSNGEKMCMANGVTSVTGNWEGELKSVAQKLVYGLKDYEICPYKGAVNVQVLSDTTEEKTNEYPVYCSKMDRHYKKTVTHEKKSDANWQLQKTGKYTGDGTIRYAMAEKHSIEEWNECYTCEPLITGNRHYSDVTVNYIEIEGLSERTKNDGDYVKYATFWIKFRQDSTYTITLDAASQPGELKTIREEKADGDCQTTTKPQELHSNKMSIPLHKTLGPYKGNGLNKTLKEEETFDQTDPVTKERTTFKISFSLQRD